MSEENKLPEPIRTGKVGRPAVPPRDEEDLKRIKAHRSRGIVKSRKSPGAISPVKRRALKEVLKTKGEVLLEPSEAARNRKIAKFVDEFIKNGGVASTAAAVAFDIKSKPQAAVFGHKLLKEVKGMANLYLDTKGASYGKLIQTAVQKMEESKSPEWWDRLMKIAGHEDFISKEKSAPVSVNIIGGQKDFLKGYIEEAVVLPDED